jgi:hypothetical protein
MTAVLERHLNEVAEAVAAACKKNHHQRLDVMIKALVDAFIAAKTAHVDVSKALYAVNADLNSADIVRRFAEKSVQAVQAMLETTADYKIKDIPAAASIVVFAKTGPMRAALEAGAPPKMIEELRYHLVLLCTGYLKQVAKPIKGIRPS